MQTYGTISQCQLTETYMLMAQLAGTILFYMTPVMAQKYNVALPINYLLA
jgi:hypothetical protein